MLGMVLIMTCIGTAVIGSVVLAYEWRALVGYWRATRR